VIVTGASTAGAKAPSGCASRAPWRRSTASSRVSSQRTAGKRRRKWSGRNALRVAIQAWAAASRRRSAATSRPGDGGSAPKNASVQAAVALS